MAEHAVRWYVIRDGDRVRRTRAMTGGPYIAVCACGWSSAASGASEWTVRGEIRYHRYLSVTIAGRRVAGYLAKSRTPRRAALIPTPFPTPFDPYSGVLWHTLTAQIEIERGILISP